MKKQKNILFILMLLVFSVVLFACEKPTEEPTNGECVHQWSEWYTLVEASCETDGVTERSCSKCSLKENGKIEKLGHKYNNASCELAKTCSVCGATEGEPLGHTWVDATCEKAKTCSVCNATEGEALGHTWVDATCDGAKTCSVCKKTEGNPLGHTWVDATCEEAKNCSVCGAVEGEALGHNYVYEYIDEDTHSHECSRCDDSKIEEHSGGEATCEAKAVCSGCEHEYGELKEHNVEKTEVSLEDISTCGGSFLVEMCVDCEEIFTFITFDVNCSNITFDEKEFEEDGYSISVQIMKCDDCNVTYTMTRKEKAIDECHNEIIESYSAYLSEDKNIEFVLKTEYEDHNFEYVFDFTGETCADGYSYVAVCSDCQAEERKENQTNHIMADKNIDLTEFGGCGGEVNLAECMVCNYCLINNFEVECNMDSEPNISSEVDENGYTHFIMEVQCSTCGLVYNIDSYDTEVVDCEYQEISYLTIKSLGIPVLEGEMIDTYSEHDYEVEYELIGSACEDGVKLTYSCKNCDHSYDNTQYSHYEEEHMVSVPGTCEGFEMWYYECAVCQENRDLHLESDNCNFVYYEGYMQCSICGLYFEEEELESEKVGCKTYTKVKYIVKMNSEVVFTYEYIKEEDDHDLNFEYEILGESCEDGLIVKESCSNCDYTYEYETSGHRYNMKEETIVGACENAKIQYDECECCNKKINYNYNLEGCYLEGEENSRTCSTCGLTVSRKITEIKEENCWKIYVYTMKVSLNEFSFEYTDQYSESNHKVVYTGEKEGMFCSSGLNVKAECSVCGELIFEEHVNDHYFITEVENIDAEMCGKVFFRIDECVGCNRTERAELCSECVRDEDEKCIHCGYTTEFFYNEGSVNGDCERFVQLEIKIFDPEGNEIYTKETGYYETNMHDYEIQEVSLVPGSSNCDEGLIIIEKCSRCDAINEYQQHGHITTESKVSLSEFGACEGTMMLVEKCLYCEKVFGASPLNSCFNEYLGSDTYGCNTCNLTLKHYYVDGEKDSDCNHDRTFIYDLLNAEEEKVYSVSYTLVQHNDHNYLQTFELQGATCEDGVIDYMRCKDCGYVSSARPFYDHEVHQEPIYLEGVCDQPLYIMQKCVCGKVVNTAYADGHMSFINEEIDESGEYIITTTTYKCECNEENLTMTETYYYVDGVGYYEVVFTQDSVELKRLEFTI